MNGAEKQLTEWLHRVTPEPPRPFTAEDILARLADPSARRGSRMQHRWVPALAAAVVLIVVVTAIVLGAFGTHHQSAPVVSPTPSVSSTVLSSCVDGTPAARAAVAGPAGQAVSDDRFVQTLTLDDNAFQVNPPSTSARPAVSADLAECNLLAAYDIQGLSMSADTLQTGLSFGLGEVTIADSLLSGHSTTKGLSYAGMPIPPPLEAYHHRLAWIAVTAPTTTTSCPAITPKTSSDPTPDASAEAPTAYQILAIDANTGAAGILYTARTTPPCGGTGLTQPYLNAAMQRLSVPWTLVSRNSDGHTATVAIPARSCDGDFDSHANHYDPSQVIATISHPLAECGDTTTQTIPLRTAIDVALPAELIHSPTGALDVPSF